jgi:hypothetical protein
MRVIARASSVKEHCLRITTRVSEHISSSTQIERPSDLASLSYVEYPGTNWKDAVRLELKAAGLTF